MYRACLAAAVLGLGALLILAPAHAASPQKSGVILAQWGGNGPPPWAGRGGGNGPPPWAGGGDNCGPLQHQLQKLYMMREVAPPWERPGVEQSIQETQAQLQYHCRGF